MIIQFEVPMRPVPKGRPRLGRSGHVFTPLKTVIAERLIKKYALIAMGKLKPFEGPVSLFFEAHFKAPKKSSKGYPRADLDNLVKIVDSLNGVVFVDDSQIIKIEAIKKYSDKDSVIIQIFSA